MFWNPRIRHTSRVVCGFLRLLTASCFLHLLQPVVFIFLHLLQPVAYPLSPGHAWLCRVLLDVLCLWEPALVLKRLRVCRLREWLATRLRIPRSGIALPFLILMQTPACTGQAQIALWLSIANVDCFVLVIDLRWQTGFRWIDKTFETTLVRLFYLLSQCISNVLESKDQGADWYLGIVKVKKSINASNIVVDIKSIR